MENERQFLIRVLQSNGPAIEMCEILFRISQVWDDLYDNDNDVSKEAINEAFWEALIELPGNTFYQRHFNTIHPLLKQYIIDWMDANLLEQENEHGQNIAFVLRDSVASVVVQCAYLVGGYDWMRTVSPQIRRFMLDEKLDDYKAELNN